MWTKTPLIQTTEVIICGYKMGQGMRAGTIGSLLVGVNSGGKLLYVGGVGTCFNQTMLDGLLNDLNPLQQPNPPFDEPVPTADA